MRKVVKRSKAAQALHELVGGSRKKTKRQRGPSSDTWLREAKEFFETGDWEHAEPKHLVGLFIFLHVWCYEVAPADLKGKVLLGARSAAVKMLREEFDGDIYAAAEYIRWVWVREKEREEWRRQKGVHGRVLNWRFVFVSGSILTEYRVDIARKVY